ncbi:hypothetical protein GCM10011579_078110 [Streptomyces albiflavescens]|uniref:Uncharacterized protein n=1 Tax=Streptomyces albiflavescens TaxID=1623582 RepID=A0A918D8T8_9ACTN|nr:hypothetical protein [Streptomyces albiflavescens]GGN86362.1 hypothetical protein GCM10011579_078110 [Streptomyces albiflavescens]
MSNGGGSTITWVVGGCLAAVITPVVMMVAVRGSESEADTGSGAGGGLENGSVPAAYVPRVLKAGAGTETVW